MTKAILSQKRAKALVCLFFLAILALGFLTVSDYGRPWDELSEIRIFRMAVMEYGEALPFETGFRKALEGMDVSPLHQSVEMDHNFALYYPLAGAACDPHLSLNQFAYLWRLQTWLIFTLGLWALYTVCRRMGLSRPLCAVAVLLLLLSPRFFAEGHYNNKDIALMTLTGLVLWQTLRLTEKPSWPRGLLFALCAGACVNTRIIGAAVCGLCGLFAALQLLWDGRLCKRALLIGIGTLAASVACYALLTPALLNDPLGYLRYVVRSSFNFVRWNGTLLFMGEPVSLASAKPPFYYLPVCILLTTPLCQLALTCAGAVSVMVQGAKKRLAFLKTNEGFAATLALLLWLLPLLGCMALRVRVYNGWRHIYFICIPMTVTAAYGLGRLQSALRLRGALRRALSVLLALALGAQSVLLALNHPFQYGYYNALVPRDAIAERYELDYWNLSVYQALRQLLTLAKDEPVIRVACTDERTRSGFAFATTYMTPEEDARFELVEYDAAARGSFYTLANTSYRVLSGFALPDDLAPVIEIKAYGATLSAIYAQRDTGREAAR